MLSTLPADTGHPSRTATTPAPWWRDAVIYQVYVRSFLDSTGDGIGDLAGVRAGLPYLRKLGVDGIWLSPFYPSPQHDHGYDVADYCDVDPVYGDLAEFDLLMADARRLGLKRLPDAVLARRGSLHFQSAAHETVVEGLATRNLRFILHVAEQLHMKIAVAHMTDYGAKKVILRHVLLRLADTFR